MSGTYSSDRHSNQYRGNDRQYERHRYRSNTRRSRERDRRRSRSRDAYKSRFRERSRSRNKARDHVPEHRSLNRPSPNNKKSKDYSPDHGLLDSLPKHSPELTKEPFDNTFSRPDSSPTTDPNSTAQRVLEMLRETTGAHQNTEYEIESSKLADFDAQSNALDVLSMLRESKQDNPRQQFGTDNAQTYVPEVSVAESSAADILRQLKTSREARQRFGDNWGDNNSNSSSAEDLPAGRNLNSYDETKFRRFVRKRQTSESSIKSSDSLDIDLDVHSELERAEERERIRTASPDHPDEQTALNDIVVPDSQPCTLFDYNISASAKKKEGVSSVSTSINRRSRLEPSVNRAQEEGPKPSSIPLIPLPIPEVKPKFTFSMNTSLNPPGLFDTFPATSEFDASRNPKSADEKTASSQKPNENSDVIVISDNDSDSPGSRSHRRNRWSRSRSSSRSLSRSRSRWRSRRQSWRSKSGNRKISRKSRSNSRSLSRSRLYRPRSRSRGHSRSPRPARRPRFCSRSRSRSRSWSRSRSPSQPLTYHKQKLNRYGVMPSEWRNRKYKARIAAKEAGKDSTTSKPERQTDTRPSIGGGESSSVTTASHRT